MPVISASKAEIPAVSVRHRAPTRAAGAADIRDERAPASRIPQQPAAVPPTDSRAARQLGALVPPGHAADRGDVHVSGLGPGVDGRE
ncbi:uncharacterized protein A1O9_03644 [Exophiala aquamarina CBS 119918]|uniref:Uncharacterized protein n=1 Tax=Exophiala aquamarina CBS 119918 TaxID=1182545 RepID=A0A072PG49_9EURO|nr:uncharacterized protein A1O9_03644 [Exophiala aquamarina CBS 119918]KEF58801.1 hypothetical protein A1O9_03644 [Exophiala aquamarina CBS 119918]